MWHITGYREEELRHFLAFFILYFQILNLNFSNILSLQDFSFIYFQQPRRLACLIELDVNVAITANKNYYENLVLFHFFIYLNMLAAQNFKVMTIIKIVLFGIENRLNEIDILIFFVFRILVISKVKYSESGIIVLYLVILRYDELIP